MSDETIFNRSEQRNERRFLRNNMSKPEFILWKWIKGKRVEGAKFRRQHGIGPFIVDFYCPEVKLGSRPERETKGRQGTTRIY